MADGQSTIYPIAMTKRGGILGSRSNKIPAMLNLTSDASEYIIYEIDGNELKEKKIVTHNYYCNLSGDANWDDKIFWHSGGTVAQKRARIASRNKGGSGTKDDPWQNFSYALERISCILQNTCCQYIRLVLSGSMKYSAVAYNESNYTSFDGGNRFIIDGGFINISDESITRYGFCYINNAYIYNSTANVSLSGPLSYRGYGFRSCLSQLYNCNGIVRVNSSETQEDPDWSTVTYGYDSCNTLIKCMIKSKMQNNDQAFGYLNCSCCYQCNCDVVCVGDWKGTAYGYGYDSCGKCYDSHGTVDISGDYNVWAYGFSQCTSHEKCSASVHAYGQDHSYAYEFA